MLEDKILHLLGYSSDLGAARTGSAQGPVVLKNSPYLSTLKKHGIDIEWDDILEPSDDSISRSAKITNLCNRLANHVCALALKHQFFLTLGGDHSCAIGTWSGAAAALKQQGDLGLIWVDAHMDSHTLETTETGNIHGMPLACLLGYGAPELTQMMAMKAKLKPANLCLIGIRSFEPGEAALLETLKVRVYFMDEVKRRGIKTVMQEAITHVSQHTAGFGISIDIDGMDPSDAPATGVKEPDGIKAIELCQALKPLASHRQLIGAEIVEFDPSLDQNQMTEKLIPELILSLRDGK